MKIKTQCFCSKKVPFLSCLESQQRSCSRCGVSTSGGKVYPRVDSGIAGRKKAKMFIPHCHTLKETRTRLQSSSHDCSSGKMQGTFKRKMKFLACSKRAGKSVDITTHRLRPEESVRFVLDKELLKTHHQPAKREDLVMVGYAKKLGPRVYPTGKQKHNTPLMTRESDPECFEGSPKIVFDELYDLRWQLGYIPEIELNYSTTPSFKASSTSASAPLETTHVTYAKRVPYPSAQMWSDEGSPIFKEKTFAETEELTLSNPVEKKSALTEYQGLKTVYITSEPHFFIDNTDPEHIIGEESLSTTNYILERMLKPLVPRSDSKMTTANQENSTGTGRSENPGTLGSGFEACFANIPAENIALNGSCIPELKKSKSAVPHDYPYAPRCHQLQSVLRPLRLARPRNDVEEVPKYALAQLADTTGDKDPFGDKGGKSLSLLSCSVQAGLKDLKLVRRRGDYYSVPIWLDLPGQRKDFPKTRSGLSSYTIGDTDASSSFV